MELNRQSLLRQGVYLEQMIPQKQLAELARALWPVKTRFELERYGSEYDGGYLLPDDLDDIQACFSPGVDINASFEIDLKQRRGIDSHQADYSVVGPPMNFRPKSFTKKFLGPVNNAVFITLDTWVRGTADFGSGKDFILQMDIEGGEYVSLLGVSREVLRRFRVISLEIHDVEAWGQPQFFRIARALFARLLQDFWVVHNHPNSGGGVVNLGGFVAPRVFELTLLRRDRAASLGYCTTFPHPLDRPNGRKAKDLPLPAAWHSPGIMDVPPGQAGEQVASNEKIFSEIYARRQWGSSADRKDPFYSGSGSRTPAIVDPYVASLQRFIGSLPAKPSALDLGCGDFSVGRRIRNLFSGYIACDVVPALIEHNRKAFADLDVDFRHLDICRDPLPSADVVMVRQVLQHLSNKDIAAFVDKVRSMCRYLVCTEHLPIEPGFTPNKDQPTGPGNRLKIGSGVDLAGSPFDLNAISEQVLCAAPEEGGLIVTKLYQLQA